MPGALRCTGKIVFSNFGYVSFKILPGILAGRLLSILHLWTIYETVLSTASCKTIASVRMFSFIVPAHYSLEMIKYVV